MLKNSFCHMPGIGIPTERRLWTSGILAWDDFLDASPGSLPFSGRKSQSFKEHVDRSLARLKDRDAAYFADSMPVGQVWRIFAEFRDSVAYLDIETTGMGGPEDYITTISLYDGRSVSCYVHGRNMQDFREAVVRYQVLVTYNGKCFDLPFIQSRLGLGMDQAHIDLRYVLKSLGYSGGLKGCEMKLGIGRKELEGVDGLFAVFLWQEYLNRKNERALETLLAYNIADTVNLETLMVMAYNLNLKATPFAGTLDLPLPSPPDIPFSADSSLIERIRRQTIAYSLPWQSRRLY
ncbi:MAG: ribonuclease H-like domain-containing protein [Syntrophobacteraceae bacterium]|nr:ribonuclease H-like domain-containing protein [Desulfobacteraceae bacterium]